MGTAPGEACIATWGSGGLATPYWMPSGVSQARLPHWISRQSVNSIFFFDMPAPFPERPTARRTASDPPVFVDRVLIRADLPVVDIRHLHRSACQDRFIDGQAERLGPFRRFNVDLRLPALLHRVDEIPAFQRDIVLDSEREELLADLGFQLRPVFCFDVFVWFSGAVSIGALFSTSKECCCPSAGPDETRHAVAVTMTPPVKGQDAVLVRLVPYTEERIQAPSRTRVRRRASVRFRLSSPLSAAVPLSRGQR